MFENISEAGREKNNGQMQDSRLHNISWDQLWTWVV